MKFKKQLSVLVAVVMMIGCFPGFVLAAETDETQIPVEQTAEAVEEEPAEVEEEQSEETVDEGEEDPVEETVELIEDSDEYSVDPAYAEDEAVHIKTWNDLYTNLHNPVNGTVYVLDNNITAPSSAARIDVQSESGAVTIMFDMCNHVIDMTDATSENSSLFFIASDVSMTIANGTITGGHGDYNGAIMNEGSLRLESMTISYNHARRGAIYSHRAATLQLDDVWINGNTSTSDDIADRGAGIHCEGNLEVMGSIHIQNNHRVVSSVSYSDNLYLGLASTYIRFNQLQGIDSDSVIYVDKVTLPDVITDGWDTSYNMNIFHLDNDIMNLELHNSGTDQIPVIEVYGTLSYLSRPVNTQGIVVDTPVTLYTESVQIGIPEGTTELSGYYFISQNQQISDRLYVKARRTAIIILADGVTLECLNGIGVPSESTLEIFTQSDDSGTLIAGAPSYSAGIGGTYINRPTDGGNINIYGGTIDSTGNIGAGIGGCLGGGIESIFINGGNVRAQGDNALDIGSNLMGAVYINGGCITLLPSSNPHTPSTIFTPNMCVSNSEGFYYTNDNRYVLWSGSASDKALTLIIMPCPHTSGHCSAIEGDSDHHSFVCDYCGHQETQLHTYENGACTGIDCTATIGTDAPQFVGHSMQIAGEVSLQYFYTLPEGATNSYVTFDGNRIDSSRVYLPERSTKPGYSCFMVQLNVSSIQIADRYTPTLHYTLNGETHEFLGAPYCIMDYINWGVAQDDNVVSEYDKNILKTLADYGYYSQIYTSAQNGWTYGVDYASVNLGRQPIGQAWDGIRTNTASYAITRNIQTSVFRAVTFSMRFGDRLSLRVFFDPADDATIDLSKFNVDLPDGTDYDYAITPLDDGRYAVTITGISARDADDTIYITYDGSVNNRVGVCPLSYVNAMMNLTGHEDGKYLVCALVNYARACGLNIPIAST